MPAYVVESACLAVAALCSSSFYNSSHFRVSNGCSNLSKLLSSNDAPDSVLEAACRAVANACCNHFLNQAQFGEAGGCERKSHIHFIS